MPATASLGERIVAEDKVSGSSQLYFQTLAPHRAVRFRGAQAREYNRGRVSDGNCFLQRLVVLPFGIHRQLDYVSACVAHPSILDLLQPKSS